MGSHLGRLRDAVLEVIVVETAAFRAPSLQLHTLAVVACVPFEQTSDGHDMKIMVTGTEENNVARTVASASYRMYDMVSLYASLAGQQQQQAGGIFPSVAGGWWHLSFLLDVPYQQIGDTLAQVRRVVFSWTSSSVIDGFAFLVSQNFLVPF